MRVLVADDHVAIRAGIRSALEAGGCIVCAEAATADAAIEAAVAHRPDICLIDLRMPGNGMRAVATITAELPRTNVVVLTVSNDSDDLIAVLRAGAVGYLLKDMDPSRLGPALEAVLAGEVVIPRRMTRRVVSEVRRSRKGHRLSTADGRVVDLSPREWEVLDLLGEGCSTAEIAGQLGLDRVTIRRHVSRLLRKLGLTSREDAVRFLASLRSPA
jgi:DNA-binding NarL/FixJ family response regulator